MLILPFFPLTTAIMGMVVITNVKFTTFECTDLMKDTLDCDVCWCYDEGGFGTVCHKDEDDNNKDADDKDDPNTYYDDSSDSFHAYVYAKKS
jgi:hypothetical protein